MDYEQAEKELAKFRKKGLLKKRLRGAAGLPSDVKKFITPEVENEFSDDSESLARRQTLVRMSATARKKLFETLLPELAPAIERGWSALGRRPYQRGHSRLPFRCPDIEKNAQAGGRWIATLAENLGDYNADAVWLATWAGHIFSYHTADQFGWLLAAAIDLGGPTGDEVLEILKATASGEHETATMGRHVTRALMEIGRAHV